MHMYAITACVASRIAAALFAWSGDATEFTAGDILVSNSGNAVIAVFARDAAFKYSIDGASLGLASAGYLAVGMRGSVFVTDTVASKIVEFDPNGLVQTISVAGLISPRGILVGPGGTLWISSHGSNEIIITNGVGIVIRTISMPVGSGAPTGLTFDAAGRLLVCSEEATAILALDPCTGSLLKTYPLAGAASDISVNDAGLLVVSIEALDEVLYLDPETGLPNQAATIGLDAPGGLATSIDGDIFVCSVATDQVLRQVYGPLDTAIFGSGTLDDPKDAVIVPHRVRVMLQGRGVALDGSPPKKGSPLGKKYKATGELSIRPGTQDVLLSLDNSELAEFLGRDLVTSGRVAPFVPGSLKNAMYLGHYVQPLTCEDSEIRCSLNLRYELISIPKTFDVKAVFRSASIQASRSLSNADFVFSGKVVPLKKLN